MKIEHILERVSAKDVLDRYWSSPDRNGRYKCCFHNGNDYNMSLQNNEKAHCFVCGNSGNAINIVKAIFGVNAKEAMAKINSDFGLGLDKPLTKQEKREFAAREEALRKRKAEIKAEEEFVDDLFRKLTAKVKEWEAIEFKTRQRDRDMYEYAESKDFLANRKAQREIGRLDYLFWLLLQGRPQSDGGYWEMAYGDDKYVVLEKIKKGEIAI